MQRARTTIILHLPEADLAEFRTAANEHRKTLSAWVQHACYAAIARRAVQRIASNSSVQASGTDEEVEREDGQLRSQRIEIELSDADVAEFTAAAAADGDGNLPHWITRQCYAADAAGSSGSQRFTAGSDSRPSA
jgi:hypothetical protein